MNKALAFFKAHKILTGVIAVIVLVWFCYSPPFKPKDPSNPLFVESWFRLRDYNRDELKAALPILFPVGTSKKYVDLMLVERGGASDTDQTEYTHGKHTYSFKPLSYWLAPDSWLIRVYYSPTNEVDAVFFATEYLVGKGYKPKDAMGRSHE